MIPATDVVDVDIHCHTFNAGDLPLKGYVRNVLRRPGLAEQTDRLLGLTPTYTSDVENAARLLQHYEPAALSGLAVAALPQPHDAYDQKEWLEQLESIDPSLTAAVLAESPEIEGAGDAAYFAWLITRSRLRIARKLLKTYRSVALFTPSLVDLEIGVDDQARTSLRDQIDVHEKVSRLSLLGALVPRSEALILPFIGFEPRRRQLGLLQDAVENHGFVGVKVYPPMGWKPIGNDPTTDRTLNAFYEWCEDQHVPILAHANRSMGSNNTYEHFSSPENWSKVLDSYPSLRLDLGHFGGMQTAHQEDSWARGFLELLERENVYADVGNHPIADSSHANAYLNRFLLTLPNTDLATLGRKLMLGSDWMMLVLQDDDPHFRRTYVSLLEQAFSEQQVSEIRGANALRFLGLGETPSLSRVRLQTRYDSLALNAPGWLRDLWEMN